MKVNGCVRSVRIDDKREQNFGRLYHSGAHTLSIHGKTNEVEDDHFDYFLLKVVRLVCGLLGDQLVDNVEQTPSQLDHVSSLLFLRVGDKVAKGHQIVRVHTFGNEYFDCLESVSEQRAASALAFNTSLTNNSLILSCKQRLISAEQSCQMSKSLTKHSNAFALYTPLTYLPLSSQKANENVKLST
ncbi:hypothetical protein BpHYR1_042564 [Brachionus plicatilis]|uniref:Uncharacterized protein n=1 Tax=Brachionus plicatilis TaxID=10195 RepID=A0A3M7SAV2_BRAPC|nr:hypothetical protein BpHYR1_042564 [Brachionus plicatilis]